MNYDFYKIALISLSANALLLFCLFSPNIVYLINKRWFEWRKPVIKTDNNKTEK